MRKKKIFTIIFSAIAVIGLVLLIITSVLINKQDKKTLDAVNPSNILEGDEGCLYVPLDNVFPVDDELSLAYLEKEDIGTYLVPLEGFKLDKHSAINHIIPQNEYGEMILQVKAYKMSDDELDKILDHVMEENRINYENVKQNEDIDPEMLEYFRIMASDESREYIRESISPYRYEVVSFGLAQLVKTIATIVTAVGGVVSAVLLLSYKFSIKKILIGSFVLIFLGSSTFIFISRKKISTAASLKEYVPGVYMLNCTEDYKLQDILDSDIKDERQMMTWFSEELLYGVPLTASPSLFGCSACAVTTPEGHHLMGRNYDYPETDSSIIWTDPKDGYASIGMVDLNLFGLGTQPGRIDPTSLKGRVCSLIFPYLTVDGMNEAGVGVCILQLDYDEIHQDNGKPDLLLNVAIRAILDTCGTADEALELLRSYDIHTMIDSSFHLFITDKSGKAYVVEWIDNEMIVTEDPAATNCINAPEFYVENPDQEHDKNYGILMDDVKSCSCTATEEETMKFMSDVASNNINDGVGTEWTCVYDLDAFKVNLYVDVNFGQCYTITPEMFK